MSPPRRLSRELPSLVGQEVRVAGHLQDYRALGGVSFALVRDRAGLFQLTLKKGQSPETLFELFQNLPRESVVRAQGTVVANPRAKVGAEVSPTAVEVLSRSAVPLPLGVSDKVGADLDTRLNHRVLDLRKPENQVIAELRGTMLWALRESFGELGFTEVETPKILRQGAEGGATMFKVDYYGSPAYLAQSPQLYKQMLMATELERVFEIAPAFRAEPSDTNRHMTEFTSIDAEMAYIDGPEELWDTVEELIAGTFRRTRERLLARGSPFAEKIPEVERPFPRVTHREGSELLGRKPGTPAIDAEIGSEEERALGDLVQKKYGNDFYLLTEFPTSLKAGTFYAMRQDAHPELTHYFDLEFRGLELMSGGQREHRVDRLEANMQAAGVDAKNFAGYLEAFRYGMPPHGGFALGLDRIVQRLAGLNNIREARLFPRDRFRLEP